MDTKPFLSSLSENAVTITRVAELLAGWQRAGFTVRRREWEYAVPTDPRVAGLERVRPPYGARPAGSNLELVR